MSAKRIILLIIAAFAAFSASAQAPLVFEPDTWDFGTIRESDGRVSHTFTGVNRGDKPLVILDVVTSCGCTVPEFSRQPVTPGGKTQITVTYDPMNRPGTFTKELWVYSNERKKVASITVQGNVTPREKSLEELYPVDAGGGLRLSTIGYANASDRTVRLSLRPQDESGLLQVDAPQRIAPGQRGEINLSYLIPAGTPRYGTLRDALEVAVDGRSNGTTIVAHGIGVDARPADAAQKSPRAEFSENILKFGPVKHTGPRRKLSFTLSNTGDAPLIVRAVEGEGHIATTLAPGRTVAPGDSFRAEVLLDPATQDFGVLTEHLMVVTNDPVRPMRRLRITAIIEE